ncbi:peptide chain release factor 2 [Patescibacteria group bacterium]
MKDLTSKLKEKYDKNSAVLSIYAGAGGADAQDWTEMLLRMYLRFASKMNWKSKTLSIKQGKEAGVKNVTIAIESPYAYGYLKNETGVHRLVRISPFNANKLRHTSFAMVEVLPEFEDMKEIKIDTQDLKIDTYKASGPGGQYVNKTESAVRVTHIPTGIVTACQSERLQGENKKRAMKLLYGRIYQLLLKTKEKEISRLKGAAMSIEWGSQIRSYVIHPYQMVKDHRSGVKSSSPDKVLDGDLDKFIEGFFQK